MFFPVRKLLINNYKTFGRAAVEFERYTVFVTFGDRCVGLTEIIDTIEFVLCHDVKLKAEDITKYSSYSSANVQTTFVKLLVYDSGYEHTFERRVADSDFLYLYNEAKVSLEEYVQLLTNMSLKTGIPLLVSTNMMNKYTAFSDIERSDMIEKICGSNEQKTAYDKIYNSLQINKSELNCALQRERYLKSQKKELKKRKLLIDNLSSTKRRYEVNRLEFYHFKLFHNKNVVIAMEPQLKETQKQYEELLRDSFNISKMITLNEQKRLVLYNELKGPHKTFQELGVKLKKKFLDSSIIEEQVEKLTEDITDLNYVVGQNNIQQIEDTIKLLEDRLKSMECANEQWSVAYNSVNLKKYSQLQMEFEDKFPEMVIKSRSSIEEMKLIETEINRYNQVLVKQRKFIEFLQNSVKKLNKDMTTLEKKSKKTELNKRQIQRERELIENLTRNIENAMESRVNEMYNNSFGLKPKQLENIVQILKSNNSGVYGRVSEFSRTPNATLQEALKCRFGFRYEAIIVDTKETAHDCISLLKQLNFNEHNETFLFLSGLKFKDTENFMIDKEGVKNIRFDYIENILSSNMESIKDALISCASKTVFCKTYDDAVKVFDLEKNNVNVVSTDDQLLFERSGFITKESNVSRTEISDAELYDLKVKKLEAEEKICELLMQPETSKIHLISDVSVIKRKLIKIIEENVVVTKKYENIKLIINQLTLKLNTLILKSTYEGNPTEDEFFREFCKHLNVTNIAEYRQRMLKPIASTTINGINDRLNAFKVELAKKKLNISMLESLKGSLNFLSMSLLVKIPDGRPDPELELNFDITKRKKQEILSIEHQLSELTKDEEVIYDKLMEKQFAMNNLSLTIDQKLRENYEVLLDCKKKMIPLELERGSLNDILYLPERDAFVYDLLRFRLEKIDVNFDDLSEDLQNANGEQMCEELCRKFNEIEAELKLFPAPESNLTEKINFFSTKLKESNEILPIIKKIVDEEEGKFSEIKKIRFDMFLDCLDDLNDSVQHIYIQLKNNTTSKAFFSIVNEEEPFRDGIKLSFWNNPQMGVNKDEVFFQTLSFLVSVIRFKKQRFAIFGDITKYIQPQSVYIYKRFFSNEKEFQPVLFASRHEFRDNCHYTILQRITTKNSNDTSESEKRTSSFIYPTRNAAP